MYIVQVLQDSFSTYLHNTYILLIIIFISILENVTSFIIIIYLHS